MIFEALAGGCIPIISDQTPWLDLGEKGAGAVISLQDKQAFVNEIETLCILSKKELISRQECANNYAVKKYEQSVMNTGYRKVFEL